jgi:hypothetical protein
MAKTRTVRLEGVEVEAAEDAEAREQAELEDLNAEEDGDLFRVTDELRALGAGVQLLITRTYPNTPDMAGYVGEMSLGEYDAEEFYNRFGPGRYKVRLRGPKGLVKGGGSVHIAKRATPPSGGAASGVADVASLLKVLNEREESRRKEDGEKKWKLLELTLPGAITLLAAVIGRPAPQGPDLASLITVLKPAPGPTMAELTASLSNLKSLAMPADTDSKLDTLLKVMEFAKTMSGDGEGKGESNWIDLIRDFVKEGPAIVGPLLEQMKARQTQQFQQAGIPMQVIPQGPSGAPNSRSRPSNPATPSESVVTLEPSITAPPSGENDMLAFFMPMIKTQLETLLKWAVASKRVELYAEVLLEELPDAVHRYIKPEKALEYLNHPHWFDVVCNVEPRLRDHQEWLTAMHDELIDILTEQIAEAQDNKSAPSQITDPLNGESPE